MNWIKKHKLVSECAVAFSVAAAAVAVALALGAVGGPGSFTAHGGESICTDAPDITEGSQVTVTDNDGKVIGTGTLADDNSPAAKSEMQQSLQISEALGALGGGSVTSIYQFTVNVPAGQPRYGVSTGGRGTVWFSEAEMRKGPELSLGC